MPVIEFSEDTILEWNLDGHTLPWNCVDEYGNPAVPFREGMEVGPDLFVDEVNGVSESGDLIFGGF